MTPAKVLIMDSDEVDRLVEEACSDYIDDCPHCGARTHFVMISNEHYHAKNRDQYNYVVFRCKPCTKLILKVFHSKQNPYSKEQNLETDGWVEKHPKTKVNADDKFVEYVPEEVTLDYEEGLRCLSASSPRAAASMFRRSLQVALIELGADQQKDLIDQIKSTSRLTDDLKDWAHNIRIFGNWGAHPQKDKLKDIDMTKAREVREFIDEFFNYVYVMPGKVATARKAYEKTKTTNDASQ